MKANKRIVVRLIVGCVLALSLTSNLHAQIDPPPDPGDTNDPPTAEEIAAQQAAIAAAQQADYSNNYAPWIIPDIFGGGSLTPDALQPQIASDLLTLSTNLAAMEAEQHAAINNLLLDQTPMRRHGRIPTATFISSTTNLRMAVLVSR